MILSRRYIRYPMQCTYDCFVFILGNDGVIRHGREGNYQRYNQYTSNIPSNIIAFDIDICAIGCLDSSGYCYLNYDNGYKIGDVQNVIQFSIGAAYVYDGVNHQNMVQTTHCALMITADHKLYANGINQRDGRYRLGVGERDPFPNSIEITLPDNEVPYMVSVGDTESIVVTMNGNVYYAGCGCNIFERKISDAQIDANGYNQVNNTTDTVKTFTKLPISNIVYGVVANSTVARGSIHLLDCFGNLYSVGYKHPGITKVLENIAVINGTDGHTIAVSYTGNAYSVIETNVEDLGISNVMYGSHSNETNDMAVLYKNDGHYLYRAPEGNSFGSAQDLNTYITNGMLRFIQVLPCPNLPITDIFTSTSQTNERTFYIKVTFEDNLANDYSRNVVNYVTKVKF